MFIAPRESKVRRVGHLVFRAGERFIPHLHRCTHLVDGHLRLVKIARDTPLKLDRAAAQHRQVAGLHNLVLHRIVEILGQGDACVQLPYGRTLHRPNRHRVLGVPDGYRQITILNLAGDGEIHPAVGDVRGQRLVIAKLRLTGGRFPEGAILN